MGGGEPELSDAGHIALSLTSPHAFAAALRAARADRFTGIWSSASAHSNAEDLLGETFVTAFRSRRNYDLRRADARPWLFGIATNHARHFWRSEGRRRSRELGGLGDATAPDHSDEATSQAFFATQEGTVASALAQLDDSHLDVLLLIAGPGLTYEEVSVALGIPIGTVRSRMSRTRQRLRELLGGSWQYVDGDPPTEEIPIGVKGNK